MGRNKVNALIFIVFVPFLVLSGCDKKPDAVAIKCEDLAVKVQTAAKCILNPDATASSQTQIDELGFDPANCGSYDRVYRSLGLTTNDAKQVAVSVDQFYETYKRKTFCQYVTPRMAQLGL